jgi:5,10-methylenetetrahydrofolate reductase
VDPSSTILIVGGNNKGQPGVLSTIDVIKILQNECPNTLWGVTNPNDETSLMNVQQKVDAGVTGIITQPLLKSNAVETLQSYKENFRDITVIGGLALPTTARGLQFWSKLLGQEEELQNDPLFRSHLAFFSQPYYTPYIWIGREFQQFSMLMDDTINSNNNNNNNSATDEKKDNNGAINGIHFMPLKNTDDMCSIFRSLNARYQSTSSSS